MNAYPTLVIGSLVMPARSVLGLRVEYEDLAARTDRRTAAGALNRRTAWSGKLRALVSGDGWAPVGLALLDLDSSYSVALPHQRSVSGATTTIVLPATRRSGGIYAPVAFAVVDGELVETSISIATNTATLGAVTGAETYRVDYYPQITAFLTVEQESLDGDRARHSWRLTAEEA